jgi:hypothetical protein
MSNIREKILPYKVTVAPQVVAIAHNKKAESSKHMHTASAIYYAILSMTDRLTAVDMFECCKFINACKSAQGFRKSPQWLQCDRKDKLAILVCAKLFGQPWAFEISTQGEPRWFAACVKRMRRQKHLNIVDVISYAWYLLSGTVVERDYEEQWLSTLLMHDEGDFSKLVCATWGNYLQKTYENGVRGLFAKLYGEGHPFAVDSY